MLEITSERVNTAILKRAFIMLFLKRNPADGWMYSPARIRIAQSVLKKIEQLENEANTDKLYELVQWGAIESLNTGSVQRMQCPLELHGSGRWLASDKGGDYRLLLEALQLSIIDISELGIAKAEAQFIFLCKMHSIVMRGCFRTYIKKLLKKYLNDYKLQVSDQDLK